MPLNNKLYQALVRVFGEVKISKETEPMSYKVITDPISRRKRVSVISGGEDYRVCCPFCGDSRFRLQVNHRWDTTDPITKINFGTSLMRCYNDGCKANRDAGSTDRQLCAEQLKDYLSPYIGRKLALATPMRKEKPLTTVKLPGKYVPLAQLPSEHPAIQYLVSRKFDPIEIERNFRVVFCYEDTNENVAGRLVIPIYRNDTLVGWQARYLGTPPADYIPKYYTMPGLPKRRIMYNYDIASKTRFGLIVEGVTDVWRVGKQGVAVFGNIMSDQQIALAAAAWGETGIGLMLDPDVMAAPRIKPDKPTACEKLFNRLNAPIAFKWGALRVILPDGTDPGSLSSDELWHMIQEQAVAAGYNHQIKE